MPGGLSCRDVGPIWTVVLVAPLLIPVGLLVELAAPFERLVDLVVHTKRDWVLKKS
jgi:hypothetical protein